MRTCIHLDDRAGNWGFCGHILFDMRAPLTTLSLCFLVCVAMAQSMPQCAVSRADDPGGHESGPPMPSESRLTWSICIAERLPGGWPRYIDLRHDKLYVHLRGCHTHGWCFRMRGQQLYYARGSQ